MDISDDEKNLFRSAMGKTKPLGKDNKVRHSKVKPKAKRLEQPEFEIPTLEIDPGINTSEVTSDQILHYSQAGVQPKTLKQLKQGKIGIEATLDLHGFTVMEAEAALHRFLLSAIEQQLRLVHLIHGKGRGQDSPPLKNLVNRFLHQSPHVLAFHSAPQNQGGVGAVNVLLKKSVPSPS